MKFPVKDSAHAVYCSSNSGPTFGEGYDLYVVTERDDDRYACHMYFRKKGYAKLGVSYDAKGVSESGLNNGQIDVTDQEVYCVADGTRPTAVHQGPWRKTRVWDEKFLTDLKEEISSYEPTHDLDTRILLLGTIGAGKSSFLNTIQSIFTDRIVRKACSGNAEQSVTAKHRSYKLRRQSGELMNVRLCDTRGMEEAYRLDRLALNNLLNGIDPDRYQMLMYNLRPGPGLAAVCLGVFMILFMILVTTTLRFVLLATLLFGCAVYGIWSILNLGNGEKVHCVALVIDSSTVEVMSNKMIQNVKLVQTEMHKKEIPLVILLTKVDKLFKEIDMSTIFTNNTIKTRVDTVSQIFGVARGCIFPVKNYEIEVELDTDINILALLALREMVNAAIDYQDNCLDEIRSEGRRLNMRDKLVELMRNLW